MRLKKGFTLAEVLIVLMVIGVIATLTVPSMMKGVQDAQYKTAFKKSYNTLQNLSARLTVEGLNPVLTYGTGTEMTEIAKYMVGMLENLNVADIAVQTGSKTPTKQVGEPTPGSVTYRLDGANKTVGTTTATPIVLNDAATGAFNKKPKLEDYWVTLQDGTAYSLVKGGSCHYITDVNNAGNITGTSSTAQAATSVNAKKAESCFAIIVDVNGIYKKPNFIEAQVAISPDNSAPMNPLTGDRYWVYYGADGLTLGTTAATGAASRIMADKK